MATDIKDFKVYVPAQDVVDPSGVLLVFVE